MKILWFINIPLPDGCRAIGRQPYVKGGWMSSLADALVETNAVKLGVVSFLQKVKETKQQIGNISHYILPARSCKELFREPTERIVLACKRICDDFQPDLIHVFGTEQFYGLLSANGYIECPAVIWLQGFIHIYYRYYFGGLSFVDVLRAHSIRDCFHNDGLIHQWIEWRNYIDIELKILKRNHFFIGRTLWDRTHLLAVNPNAKYYHCEDMLRPEFYSKIWDFSKVRRHSVFVPTGHYPLKGFHVALRAIAILKKEFPDILLRISDSPLKWYDEYKGRFIWLKQPGYAAYLKRLIKKLNIRSAIISLGFLSADSMAAEMQAAHVVVIPSFIENSCNALKEAQIVGVPVVASNSGGTSDLIKDRETGFLFAPGNEKALADNVRKIFLDDILAANISMSSRQTALQRNNKETIVKTMLDIYKDVHKNG